MRFGGAERVASTWADGLIRMGHKVAVYADFSQGESYHLNPQVKRYNSTPRRTSSSIGKVTRSVRTIATLRSAVLDFIPDVVVLLLHAFSPEILVVRRLTYHFKIVSTEHNSFERPASAPISRKESYRKFILNRRYDAVSVLTVPDKAIADAAGVENVHVLHNPLFTKPLDHLPDKDNIVLAVGRMDDWHYKGFDILIDAWKRISPAHPGWKLRIIGSGDDASVDYLNSLASGCDTIEFKPFTNNILEEYSKAAIFCLSSRYEGWGLVLAEAMSQHCAVVACDYKGRQAELVTDGVDGLLCKPEDAAALAGRISELITDSDLRHALQQAAADNLAQYAPDRICRQLEAILLEVVRK